MIDIVNSLLVCVTSTKFTCGPPGADLAIPVYLAEELMVARRSSVTRLSRADHGSVALRPHLTMGLPLINACS